MRNGFLLFYFVNLLHAFSVPERFEEKNGFYFYPLPLNSPGGYSLEPTVLNKNWVIHLRTQKFGSNFIYFFAPDIDRPLNYPCSKLTVICDFSISMTAGAENTIYLYAHVNSIALPVPAMFGNLLFCVAKNDMFRLRPLMRVNIDFFCKGLDTTSNLIQIYTETEGDNCYLGSSEQCPGVPLIPEKRVIGGFDLDVHTWYMTKENYEEMYIGIATEVFAPILAVEYVLLIFGTVFEYSSSHHETECFIKTYNNKFKLDPKWTRRYVIRYWYGVLSRLENGGLYSMECVGQYRNVMNEKVTITLQKSIILTFFEGTLIVLSGKSDKNITVVQGTEDVVWVAPDLRAAIIMVSVYNVLPVIHFNVQRFPSGNLPTAIHVKSVSSDGLDHVTKYEIVLTRITNDTAGRYQIKVHDNSGEVKKHFKMFQVMRLTVLVGPYSKAVEEGTSPEFYCSVDGNVIGSVKWSKEIGTSKSKMTTKVLDDSKETMVIQMMLNKVAIEDSGLYLCTGSNEYETVSAASKLIVWPKGDPRITDYYEEAFEENVTRLPPGPYVLNITDEEIIKGYHEQHSSWMIPALYYGGPSAFGLFLIIVLSILIRHHWRKRKRRIALRKERRRARRRMRDRRRLKKKRLSVSLSPSSEESADEKETQKIHEKQTKSHVSPSLFRDRIFTGEPSDTGDNSSSETSDSIKSTAQEDRIK